MGFVISIIDTLIELILYPFRKFPKLGILVLAGIVALGATGFNGAWTHLYHQFMTAITGHPSIQLPHIPTPKKS